MTDTTQTYSTHHTMLLSDTLRLELHGFGRGIVKYTTVREVEADAAKAGA